MDKFVSYYRKLCRECTHIHISLMESEVINIEYEADGLCLPGLGLRLFGKCGRALLQVLDRALPDDNKAIQAQVTSAVDGDGNGYKLLWNIATMNIPIFDVIKPVSIPKWTGCIHRFRKII